jgi:hypothetical protein
MTWHQEAPPHMVYRDFPILNFLFIYIPAAVTIIEAQNPVFRKLCADRQTNHWCVELERSFYLAAARNIDGIDSQCIVIMEVKSPGPGNEFESRGIVKKASTTRIRNVNFRDLIFKYIFTSFY